MSAARARKAGAAVAVAAVAVVALTAEHSGGKDAAPAALPSPVATSTPVPAPTAEAPARIGPARIGPAPLGPVAPGQRPPQVVVIAFDGAGVAVGGKYPMFQYWRDVSRTADARFTYFLSGPYLLTHDNIDHYNAPQLGTATQAMPFEVSGVLPLPAQSEPEAIRYELEQLRDAHAEGSEIATHFNGHICGDEPGSVARFTAADWASELDQFDAFLADANLTNGIEPPVELGFTGQDIVGSRTPCLQGDFRALYPVLEARGFRYDTSPTPDASAPTAWPQHGWAETGPTSLWTFPLAYIPSYGTGRRVLGMDYNLCFQHDGCHTRAVYPAARTEAWSQQTLDTYRQYFQTNYTGARAPVVLGNHFEMWHGGAYTDALAAFAVETCAKPEVRCVSYRELAQWLTDTPSDQLTQWRAGDFPHFTDAPAQSYGRPVPNAPRPEAVGPQP